MWLGPWGILFTNRGETLSSDAVLMQEQLNIVVGNTRNKATGYITRCYALLSHQHNHFWAHAVFQLYFTKEKEWIEMDVWPTEWTRYKRYNDNNFHINQFWFWILHDQRKVCFPKKWCRSTPLKKYINSMSTDIHE